MITKFQALGQIASSFTICSRLFHRIQHHLAHFNLYCSYVDCIVDCSVLLVNRSIIIILQNRYKKEKNPLQNLRTSQPAIQPYRAAFPQQLKQFHLLKFHSFFCEQTNFNITYLQFMSLNTRKS